VNKARSGGEKSSPFFVEKKQIISILAVIYITLATMKK
jgi:hypothetical protein